jgi:hypothetical protein
MKQKPVSTQPIDDETSISIQRLGLPAIFSRTLELRPREELVLGIHLV